MTSKDVSPSDTRPPRADVLRNRARLLGAAGEVFRSQGAEAPMETVARRAGVGVGTLYRHFPSRQDLLEALLADTYDRLGAQAYELLGDPSPGEALMTWLCDFVAQVTAFRGLAASVLVTLRDERSELFQSCRTLKEAGEALFAHAQRSKAASAGVEFLDVLKLVGAIGMATEQEPEATHRLLTLALHGVMPEAHEGAWGDP